MIETVLRLLCHIEEQNDEILFLLRKDETRQRDDGAGSNEILTVTQAARLLKVNRGKILGWIASGRLRAMNVAKGNGLSRYRVARADLELFLVGRSPQQGPAPTRRRRPRVPEPAVKYFPEK